MGFKNLSNLSHLELSLMDNTLGENKDNLKYLGDILRQMPNLLHLNLDLAFNDLGETEDN